MAADLSSGKVVLKRDDRLGFLPALLRELEVPESSQMLVYSKTSLQRYHISSRTPRAIFFNDRVYVAWIPSAPLLEILSVDSRFGSVLYTLDQAPSPSSPRLVRDNRCLECHISTRTLDIPGTLVRSFKTSPSGEVDLLSGGQAITHDTPLEERWGGWFVTDARGRLITPAALAAGPSPTLPSVPPELDPSFTLAGYPRATSDVVALLVLEHQAHMQNLITRLHYEGTALERRHGELKSLDPLCDIFLRYLLFAEEAPLPGDLYGGAGGDFAREFEARGPKDPQGRSLRQLDLHARLFKYPCSYLIQSDAFHRLPLDLKRHLYRKLWNVLTGERADAAFARLTPEVRRQVLDILIATQPGLPAYWKL